MHSDNLLRTILRPTVRAFLPALVGVLLLISLASARAQALAPAYVFSHLAGSIGGPGSTDKIGPAARFNSPLSTAVDSTGNVYVADTENHTIRKITPGGVVTTLAGTAGMAGSADGAGTAARFNGPEGVTVDSTGTVYVADTDNHTIRKITAGGVVTTLAGRVDVVGSADGTGSGAEFGYPKGIAVDSADNVYVANIDPYTSTIRKISSGGVVTTLASTGFVSRSNADGAASAVQFDHPSGVAVDSAGTIYVSESWNHTIRKITPGGVMTTLAGLAIPQTVYDPDIKLPGIGGNADGTGVAARFNGPAGVAVDSAGTLYVADTLNNTIRKITPAGVVTTLAGTAEVGAGSADGTGPAARFNGPEGVAVDSAGNIYVADSGNNTVRKVTPGGVVNTLAGMANISGSADGTGPAARFYVPASVAVDGAGTVYVADALNYTIRKITPGGVATTLAGTAGIAGSADGTGPDAQFYYPRGVAVDSIGTVYVADTLNNTIRKITPAGVVTTLAGTAGVGTLGADGTGSAARFDHPIGVAVDSVGTVYVADSWNNTIRKITPAGVVTTLAGTAGVQGSADGTGPAARFNSPIGVALDSAGNVYVADADGYFKSNHTIRKITPEGVVTTLGGVAELTGSEDGMGPAARFNRPLGIAVDSVGAIYVADSGNNAIRKSVSAVAPVITTPPQSQSVLAGGSVQFSVVAGGVPAPTYQWYFNGSAFSGANTNTLSFISARSTDAGDYTVVVTNSLGSVTSSKATLTVSAATVTPPMAPAPASGGGGSIDAWFALGLIALAGLNRFSKRKHSPPHTLKFAQGNVHALHLQKSLPLWKRLKTEWSK